MNDFLKFKINTGNPQEHEFYYFNENFIRSIKIIHENYEEGQRYFIAIQTCDDEDEQYFNVDLEQYKTLQKYLEK